MVTTKDFEEHISEEELMGLIQRRWKSRVRSIIFLQRSLTADTCQWMGGFMVIVSYPNFTRHQSYAINHNFHLIVFYTHQVNKQSRGVWEIEAFMMLFQKKKLIESVVMEGGDCPVRRWDDLDIDMLVKILQSLDLFQLISVIPQVCRVWRLAGSDQRLWKMLDLSVLQSNFIRITVPPYVYVDSPSREKLTRLLKICLNLKSWKHTDIDLPLQFVC